MVLLGLAFFSADKTKKDIIHHNVIGKSTTHVETGTENAAAVVVPNQNRNVMSRRLQL
jgi:hypothetical protein